MDQLPRVKPGQLLGVRDERGLLRINATTAAYLNRLVAEIKRLGRVSAQPPLRWSEDASGRRFACDLVPAIWAKLSGSGNPYSYTQQRYNPATNTWSDMAGGRTGTSNCYESTGKAGLAGKVVRLEYVATANDWRFHYVGSGPPTLAWTFNVFGCGSKAIPGATIELRQSGVLIDSCVTGDGTGGTTLGRCTINVPAGTYDITIIGPTGAGFVTSTSTASIAAAKTTNTTLASDASHICSTCCGFAFPNTIHFTDSDGPQTLTLTSTTPNLVYTLNSTTQVSEACNVRFSPGPCEGCASPGTILKSYELVIFSSGCTARLRIFTSVTCCDGTGHFCNDLTNSTQAGNNITIPITSGNCGPLNLVFSVPTSFSNVCSGNSLSMPGGGGTLAFTS